MKNIAFIGAGNMASAIAGGIISSNLIRPENVILYDTNPQQYSRFNSLCKTTSSIKELVTLADYIFLSIKPQCLNDVLFDIRNQKNYFNKVFVSICAGVKIGSIENILGEIKLARAMPNTPLLIGKGTTGICRNKHINDEEFEFVRNIFSSSGYVGVVNEDDMDNVTALTGSAPAYVYLFTKSVLEGAKRLGFSNDDALNMFCNTILGSVNMIQNSEKSIDELIKMVTSPNGTTERALNVFYEKEFSEIIYEAMKACSDRANELSRLI